MTKFYYYNPYHLTQGISEIEAHSCLFNEVTEYYTIDDGDFKYGMYHVDVSGFDLAEVKTAYNKAVQYQVEYHVAKIEKLKQLKQVTGDTITRPTLRKRGGKAKVAVIDTSI